MEPLDKISQCTIEYTLFELSKELRKSRPEINMEDIKDIIGDLVNVRYRSEDRMHEFTKKIKIDCIKHDKN